MTKNRKIIVGIVIIVILFFLFFINERNIIFQEGNPLNIIIGITKLYLTDNEIINISNKTEKYIIKAKNQDLFIRYMNEKGWKYETQLGAAVVFEKDGKTLTFVGRMYTKKFKIFTIKSA